MHFHELFVVLASFLALTAAHLFEKNKEFRVHQKEAGRRQHPVVQLAHAYAKHGKQAPENVLKAASSIKAEAAAKTQSGSVVATPEAFDRAYLCEVTVGQTKMMLDFDTGSSDLWVFSTGLPKNQQGSHVLYPLSGQKIPQTYWDIQYADGSSSSGTVYADSVAIGPVTATIQAVEAATSVSSMFVRDLEDGLVGLGPQSGNTCYNSKGQTCNTFMTQVGPTLPSDLFTATLRHDAPGEYDFGYIDSTKYDGPLVYKSVDSFAPYWQFSADGYAVGSGPRIGKSGSIRPAIADTGATLMLLDQSINNKYYGAVPGSHFNTTYGLYTFKCTTQLPNFMLYLGSHKAVLPGSYINHGPLNDGTGNCVGGMVPNTNLGFNSFGDAFLRSQFVVFDLGKNGNPRIGFAQQKGIPSS